MKKILGVGLIVVGALFSHLQAFSQDAASKPAYKDGEIWLFASKEWGTVGSSSKGLLNGTYELAIVDGKLKVASVNGSQKEELEPRPPALSCLLGFCPNLDFPLTVGKQWTREYKAAYIGGTKQIARKVTYEIKGIEQVTTPAGTFRAFKLESDDRSGPQDYFVTTYWYSPETKSVVKSKFDSSAGGRNTGLQSEKDLIKFTPAK